MFGFGGIPVSKASIEHGSRFAHASSGAENEWSEGCQLNFIDPLLIQAPFDLFMMGIAGKDEKPLVGWCVWVKYLDIKKCTVVKSSPEFFDLYVYPGTFVSDGGCISESVSIKGL